jgi:hypothetical protein
MERQFIVKIESFEGKDTYVRCGDDQQDYLFCVVRAVFRNTVVMCLKGPMSIP